jgi:methylated-DNA-[protein]-cysteine S-methyltransferase
MTSPDAPAPMDAGYNVFETAAGPCGLAWSAEGLTQVQLPEANRAATEARLSRRSGAHRCEAPPAWIAAISDRMRSYFEGAENDFADVPLDLRGVSAFNARVYAALRMIGWGQATSYGALAIAIGEPGAARAIGAAMGANPWPLIVPCHRVLAASGRIGGFSAHGGQDTKRHMLQLERIDADGAAPLLPGLFD